MTILYNPKRFNGSPSVPVKDVFMNKIYELKVNEMAQFDSQVAKYLTTKFGFLEVVSPEQVPAVKQKMEAGEYACEHCNEVFDSEKKLQGHKLGKHKLSEEHQAALDSVPLAQPVGEVRPRTRKRQISPEESEGIPGENQYDKDGVQWVGAGLETDTMTDMKPMVPGITKGVFGG